MVHVMLLALKNQMYRNGKKREQGCPVSHVVSFRYIQLKKYLHICILKKWQKKRCCYIAISYIVFLLRVSQC